MKTQSRIEGEEEVRIDGRGGEGEGNDLAMGGARQCQSGHVQIQVTREKKKNGATVAYTSVETLTDPHRHLCVLSPFYRSLEFPLQESQSLATLNVVSIHSSLTTEHETA